MVVAIARPKLEGTIAVGDDRQIGFAEFGDPQGRAVFWLHGTPGARRQIPMEARVYAEQRQIRLIGVDRPGIGSSTPHQYDTIAAFADDLRTIADTLGIDRFEVIGLWRPVIVVSVTRSISQNAVTSSQRYRIWLRRS